MPTGSRMSGYLFFFEVLEELVLLWLTLPLWGLVLALLNI